eukprot:11156246-Lingulodinium_polyedra.AAC.1
MFASCFTRSAGAALRTATRSPPCQWPLLSWVPVWVHARKPVRMASARMSSAIWGLRFASWARMASTFCSLASLSSG